MELIVKTARNGPCPCGSGRRYKTCCGRLTAGGETQARERSAREDAEAAELSRLAALIGAGGYAELEDAAREVQGAYPESGFVWQLLGVALSKQGKDALQALAAAARCMPA